MRALQLLYERFAKGDFSGGGELWAPDVVFQPFPERSALHGAPSVAAYMQEFLAQWSDYRVVAEEFLDAGHTIVVKERQYATGASSGIETVMTFYAVWTFGDGRVTSARWEDDRSTALEAAGLSD